jgi:hypothetical protein
VKAERKGKKKDKKRKFSIITIIIKHMSVHFISAQERHAVRTGNEE